MLETCAQSTAHSCHIMENVASNHTRELTAEEIEKLRKQDETVISEFKKNKLELEARKNWDLFYKRNETRFFRDRHWTTREFEQLAEIGKSSSTLLEVGCGVGNFLFPLLEENPNLNIYACDFSARAVQMVKEDTRFDLERLKAFTCDITQERSVINLVARLYFYVMTKNCPENNDGHIALKSFAPI